MKKSLSLMLVLLLAFMLAACGNDKDNSGGNASGSPADEGGNGKKIVIGVSILNLANEFTATLAKGIEEKGKELGVKIIINDGQKDPNKQIQQVETFIAQKVDAIIFNPIEAEASSPAVDKAKEAGIPIINVNSVTKSAPDAFVGSRDQESAKMAIDYLAERLGSKGNIVMMHGHLGQSAEIDRTEGAVESLKTYPDMKLIAEQTAEWNRDKALTLMQNWLQAHDGQIQGVFAQNDEMGMGALKALEDAGVKKDIVLVSVDAIADALQAVKDGRLDATVFQNAAAQGGGALETALKIINKETFEKEVFVPFELVTKDNVDQYLK
ncbi:substrate-binding domain-containing protein [Cohnella herbarum]|uniref:Sugar ABC transporter substrate-binding protein n=1 Tax=Cohnella herbarum TaxID=2728023 RepID=A0A7Z2ZQ89_9BACL|nr:substrate-binding domain-containing protein [Cohnella herbarum]QJD87695.1 sugar ABC transporter substrate-binding protein [Cohnella herbarum]